MGWEGVGREENKPSERGAMKWRAGKARCMAITTTCVYCLEDDNECIVYVLYSRLGKTAVNSILFTSILPAFLC